MKEYQPLKVYCHAGFRGEEYPISLEWENTRIEIKEIEKRWLEPGWRYFRIKSQGCGRFLLRCKEINGQWQGRLLSQV